MSSDSTRRKSRGKGPKKPRADFPLRVHKGTGYWCKKVRGRVHYFGKVADDPEGKAALEEWLRVKDYLAAGREPPPKDSNRLTLEGLCNHFMQNKERLRDAGEIQPASWREYHATCKSLLDILGKTRAADDVGPDEFERVRAKFSSEVGPTRLCKLVQIIRSVFKYGMDAGLLLQPVRFGPGFKRPSKSVLRRRRAERGLNLLSADEIRRLLGVAGPVLRAMVLLGLNCGYGNTDIGRLERRHLDLDERWATFPRPKSGVARRAKLWPETAEAIRAALDLRPNPKDPSHGDRVFITKYGNPWATEEDNSDPVALEFFKLLKPAGITKRPGLGFYMLRHTARTIMDQTQDFPAARLVMGHADASIDDFYRETIDDSRLEAVAAHVHRWLYADDPKGGKNPTLRIADGESSDTATQRADEGGEKRRALRLFIA
jgi:integrase